ncbi:MAG TPA: TrkA C-terminal domain-containing protein [Clostridia bacterium]|nr:TrkA C-terminal domain-containing protein [Clostridia bacterium]
MDEKIKIITPRYQQIAADVAAKIASKHYKVGERIYTRSSLASQYGVSPETARRAISILADLKIVETVKGSGVTIISYDNAVQFVKQFRDIKSASVLKKDILKRLDKQMSESKALKNSITELLDRIAKFKTINPFVPFEITVEASSKCIGKTLSEINFWHNTTATVVGIAHKDTLLMSPGPYAVLHEGDTIYFVGDENTQMRVEEFLGKGK